MSMNRVELKHLAVRPANPFAGWQSRLRTALLLLFVLDGLLVWVRLYFGNALFGEAAWPDGLLLILATASTLVSLSGQLPAQNAILAAVAIGCAGAGADTLSAITGIPFGLIVYHPQAIGRMLFSCLPWPVPLIWVVILLNARGVARLILRRCRGKNGYGLWVLALTVVLALLFEASWEPYASVVKQYWSWKPTRIPSDWFGMPWSNLLGAAVTISLILLFVTPVLINKSPVKLPPLFDPVLIWELLSCLFLTGVTVQNLWGATCLIAAQMLAVAVCSLLSRKPPNLR